MFKSSTIGLEISDIITMQQIKFSGWICADNNWPGHLLRSAKQDASWHNTQIGHDGYSRTHHTVELNLWMDEYPSAQSSVQFPRETNFTENK